MTHLSLPAFVTILTIVIIVFVYYIIKLKNGPKSFLLPILYTFTICSALSIVVRCADSFGFFPENSKLPMELVGFLLFIMFGSVIYVAIKQYKRGKIAQDKVIPLFVCIIGLIILAIVGVYATIAC